MDKSVSATLEDVFLAQRQVLMAFLRSRNAGDAAEDLLHEMWMRLPADGADIRAPMSYLYRMADTLVIDLHRRRMQAARRDTAWVQATGADVADRSEQPAADRVIEARQAAARVLAAISGEGERVARVFRRHRLDGLSQREVAAELGLSLSTIEGDLRRAYRALAYAREKRDEV